VATVAGSAIVYTLANGGHRRKIHAAMPNLAPPGAGTGDPQGGVRRPGAQVRATGPGYFQALARQLTSSAGPGALPGPDLKGHPRLYPTRRRARPPPTLQLRHVCALVPLRRRRHPRLVLVALVRSGPCRTGIGGAGSVAILLADAPPHCQPGS